MSQSKWTIELCQVEALKYTYRTEFQKKSRGAYKAAYKYGWLNMICVHMTKPNPHNYKWNKNTLIEEAKKYTSKKQFRKNSNGAYQVAIKLNCMEEICKHMIEVHKPHKYWTKERCADVASKCNNKKQFCKEYLAAYSASHKNGWIAEICEHMTSLGHEYLRYVYKYLFSDNSIYIGLTFDVDKRSWQHKNDLKSKVYKHILLTNEQPILEILTPDPIDVNLAESLEKKLIKYYRDEGYKILNGNNGGGIGSGKLKWTLVKLQIEAEKYKTRGEFQKYSSSAYGSARDRGLLDEICKHMYNTKKKPHNYLTKERCAIIAKKYQTKKDFRLNDSSAYGKATKESWIVEICGHMIETKKPNGYWNLERCITIAKKSTSYIEFQSSYAYASVLKNGWLDIIKKYFKDIKLPNGYWTFERCKIEAKKYQTKTEFQINAVGAYDKALKNKWLVEICKHMTSSQLPSGYWTFERCEAESKKYLNKRQFMLGSSSAHTKSYKNGWLNIFYPSNTK